MKNAENDPWWDENNTKMKPYWRLETFQNYRVCNQYSTRYMSNSMISALNQDGIQTP